MPIWTRKEFQAVFGVTSQYISVNVKRGNLVMQGKYLNSDIYENKAWIEKWESEGGVRNANPVPKEPPKPKKKAVKKAPKKKAENEAINLPPATKKPVSDLDIPEMPDGLVDIKNMQRHELDLHKKRVDLQKAQEELELARIKKEKQLGMVIPTDLVLGVFARHFKSVTNSFYQAADNLLIEIIPDRKRLSQARSRLVDIINSSVEDAKSDSKKEIKSLVDEYAESRGKGERK